LGNPRVKVKGAAARLCPTCATRAAGLVADGGRTWVYDLSDPASKARWRLAVCGCSHPRLTLPVQPIPDDYEPTPANAIKGGCGCKK
jgi:hypothetical protein